MQPQKRIWPVAVYTILSLLFSVEAVKASCIEYYKDQIEKFDKYIILAGTAGAATTLAAFMVSKNGDGIDVGTAVAGGATAASLVTIDVLRERYKSTLSILETARDPRKSSDDYDKLLKKTNKAVKKSGKSYTKESLAKEVRAMDDNKIESAFCPVNSETGKRELYFPKKIRKIVISKLKIAPGLVADVDDKDDEIENKLPTLQTKVADDVSIKNQSQDKHSKEKSHSTNGARSVD